MREDIETMEIFAGTSQSAELWPTCQTYTQKPVIVLWFPRLVLVRISALSHLVLVYPQVVPVEIV